MKFSIGTSYVLDKWFGLFLQLVLLECLAELYFILASYFIWL